MIVMKLGGSSVESAAALERGIGLVRCQLDRRPVVVISAMGKTTRRLLGAAEAAAGGDLPGALAAADSLEDFHRRESAPVTGPGELEPLFATWFGELRQALSGIAAAGELAPRAADAVAGYGELLASAILAAALRRSGVDSVWIDCRRVIITDARFTRANPDYERTGARLQESLPALLSAGRVPVVGGYVGATREGVTTTLGKEGSDFTAAIVGAALGAEEVQIWTDVDGILTADPHLYPGALRVATLSFAEALELACSGSKKPHPGTLGPASRRDVPIRIRNTRRPAGEGTVIGRRGAAPPGIKSVACRGNAHLLYALADGAGSLAGVLAACERLRPDLMVLGTTGAGVPLALQHAGRLAEVREALAGTPEVAEVGVVPGRTVISLISEDLRTSPELAARALEAAREYEPRLVLEGVACPAVRFLVRDEEARYAVAAVHERLFPGGGTGTVVP